MHQDSRVLFKWLIDLKMKMMSSDLERLTGISRKNIAIFSKPQKMNAKYALFWAAFDLNWLIAYKIFILLCWNLKHYASSSLASLHQLPQTANKPGFLSIVSQYMENFLENQKCNVSLPRLTFALKESHPFPAENKWDLSDWLCRPS